MGEAIATAIAEHSPGSGLLAPRAALRVAIYPEDGRSFEALLRSADERLLRTKWKGGRDPAPGRDDKSLRMI